MCLCVFKCIGVLKDKGEKRGVITYRKIDKPHKRKKEREKERERERKLHRKRVIVSVITKKEREKKRERENEGQHEGRKRGGVQWFSPCMRVACVVVVHPPQGKNSIPGFEHAPPQIYKQLDGQQLY